MSWRNWPARAWRKLLALLLLAGGGIALTLTAWRLVTLVARRSPFDPWPLAYALYGALGLIAIVLLSFGWVLGRTTISGSVGAASFNASGGSDDADEPPAPIRDGDSVTIAKGTE